MLPIFWGAAALDDLNNIIDYISDFDVPARNASKLRLLVINSKSQVRYVSGRHRGIADSEETLTKAPYTTKRATFFRTPLLRAWHRACWLS